MRGGTAATPACGRKPSPRRPPSGPKEKAKAVTSSSAATARRPHGSRSGTPRARQVAAEPAEAGGHAPLVLAPQRVGKGAFPAAQAVGLDEDRRVLEPVGALDAAVDLGAPSAVGTAAADSSAASAATAEARRRRSAAAASGSDAEDAEPGQAEEQAGDDQQRQDAAASRARTAIARAGSRVRARCGQVCLEMSPCRIPLPSALPARTARMRRRPQDSKNSSNRGKGEAGYAKT